MKLLDRILILLVTSLVLNASFLPKGFAQHGALSDSLSISSSKEKLHALALTRFHFITLKQFHSALFSFDENPYSISDSEARILNGGLNAFLISSEREQMLLEALRQNKAVHLRFSIPEETEEYQMSLHPTKPLLYRLKSVTRSVPASIEIRPLLDRPIAFQITLEKEGERYSYNVDWSGRIASLS